MSVARVINTIGREATTAERPISHIERQATRATLADVWGALTPEARTRISATTGLRTWSDPQCGVVLTTIDGELIAVGRR